MLENKKHVFWQALFVTALFFLVGLVLGVYFEQIRTDNFNVAYSQSEIALYDSFALGKLVDNGIASCVDLKRSSLLFADRIYEEALSLEKFDDKSQLTETIKSIHTKYDLLRTFLWIDAIKMKEACPTTKINTVVYLYTYNTDDVETKAKQIVWSRILSDLKEEKGSSILLIPIAQDSNLISLQSLEKKFGVNHFPAVVINEKNIVYTVDSVADLKKYLN